MIFPSQEVISLDAKVYEVLSLAMRYFFTCMGVMIVWRSFSWLRKDRRQKHRRLKQLPDAGTIGIFTVEQGSKQLKAGEAIPVPHEGVLGYLRTCDVVVPVDDVATMHLDFTFADGKGLYIYPRRGCEAVVDGVPLVTRRDSKQHPMQHGSVLMIGQAVLRLGVFAGLNVQEARYSAFPTNDFYPEEDEFTPEVPPAFYSEQPLPPQTPPIPPVCPGQPTAPYPPSPFARPVNPPAPPYQYPIAPKNIPWQGGDSDAP